MADTEMVLSFHKSLYLPAGVAAAVAAYEPYTSGIDVEDNDIELVVTLRGFDAGYGEAFGDSFSNQALFETIVRARETLAGVPV